MVLQPVGKQGSITIYENLRNCVTEIISGLVKFTNVTSEGHWWIERVEMLKFYYSYLFLRVVLGIKEHLNSRAFQNKFTKEFTFFAWLLNSVNKNP